MNSDWISVKDRLPEVVNGMFLVVYLFQNHQCRAIAAWYNRKFWDINLKSLDVTHWQDAPDFPPIPAPPENEATDD